MEEQTKKEAVKLVQVQLLVSRTCFLGGAPFSQEIGSVISVPANEAAAMVESIPPQACMAKEEGKSSIEQYNARQKAADESTKRKQQVFKKKQDAQSKQATASKKVTAESKESNAKAEQAQAKKVFINKNAAMINQLKAQKKTPKQIDEIIEAAMSQDA